LTISKAKVRVAHLTLQGPVHAKALVSVLRSMFWRGSPLPAVLVLLVSLGATHAADGAAVGKVSDVDGTTEIVSGGASTAAAKGAAVRMNDELNTGADGRLQVTFRDNTVLTLSENARVVIDRYVYDPEQGVGDVLLTTTQGAFRFATGKMKELTEKTITVETPVAQVGVRGTEFWGGPVDGEYSVLLLAGEVNVRNQAGTVVLNKPGFATMIRSRLVAPVLPSLWSPDRIQSALTRTVTRQGLKQLERELRNFNIPGLRNGKDRLPDILKQQDKLLKQNDRLPDVIKPKNRKPKIDPGGLERHLRRPELRLPW
jgi:FecR protein